jgi:mRNA interferase RelE/StbE
MEMRFTRRALRDIRKLSPPVRRQVEIALDALFDDRRAGDRLHGEWEGDWKLRSGEYRVIYRIMDRGVVEVLYVRHRREAYREDAA